MNNKKIKNKKGFTLIELLTCLGIITIISLGFFKFINGTINMNLKNEKDIQAINIAQSEIEKIRESIKSNGLTIENGEWEKFSGQSFLESDFMPEYIVEYNEKQILNKYIIKEVEDTNDSTGNRKFKIKILFYRQKKNNNDNKYLYTIDIRVSHKNDNISKKVTKLRYQVYG